MAKRSNVIYIGVNPNLKFATDTYIYTINENHLLNKNIKPWKSKDGNKLMYQLYDPSTKSRTVYTMPNEQELIEEGSIHYHNFLPETSDAFLNKTQLRIIKNNTQTK